KTLITSASRNDSLVVWDLVTGREKWRLRLENSWGCILGLSPDGRLLASASLGFTGTTGGLENAIHIWEVATRRKLRTFELDDAHVSAIDFSPDCRTLYTGMDNGSVLIWNLTRGD